MNFERAIPFRRPGTGGGDDFERTAMFGLLKRILKVALRPFVRPLLERIRRIIHKEMTPLHENTTLLHKEIHESAALLHKEMASLHENAALLQKPTPEKPKNPDRQKNYALDVTEFNRLLTLAKSREVIVVGANHAGLELQSALEAQGARVEYFVDYVSAPGSFGGRPLYNLYDLLLGDLKNKIVAFAMWNTGGGWSAHMYALLEMGIRRQDIIIPLKMPVLGHVDAGLGHNYAGGEKPGFRIWGEHTNKHAKVIVVLGGSTSDSFLAKNSDFYISWPELLYRRLSAFDKDIVVYSGAVFCFCSTQEMQKLLRDVLPLKPHVIISYSGFNDIGLHRDEESLSAWPRLRSDLDTPLMWRPYLNSNTQIFFEAAVHAIGPDRLPEYIHGSKEICYGLPNMLTPDEVWLNNMTIMHSVAQAFSCEFMGILQPSLYTTSKARNLSHFTELLTNEFERTAYFKKYIGKIKERLPQHPYLLDYTDLFSNNDDALFCDFCHVRPLGNHRIAAKVHSDMIRLNLLKSRADP